MSQHCWCLCLNQLLSFLDIRWTEIWILKNVINLLLIYTCKMDQKCLSLSYGHKGSSDINIYIANIWSQMRWILALMALESAISLNTMHDRHPWDTSGKCKRRPGTSQETPPEVITKAHSAATIQVLCGQWRKSKKIGKLDIHNGLFKIGWILHIVIKIQFKASKNFPTRDISDP